MRRIIALPDDRLPKTGIPLIAHQHRQAADVLAKAFFEDPFFTFSIPDDTRRKRILPWLFGKTIRYGQSYGQVYTTSDLEGVALWLGPQKPGLTWMGTLLSGLFLLPLKLSRQELGRSLRLAKSADNLHAKSISGPHWYLLGLGVEPKRQSQGVGSALLQIVLAQADRQSQACYLDTNNEANLSFYERFGFRLAGIAQSILGSPNTWGLLRQPK
jgi:ribosomal protein S18 acetylase RimI-like enzyme